MERSSYIERLEPLVRRDFLHAIYEARDITVEVRSEHSLDESLLPPTPHSPSAINQAHTSTGTALTTHSAIAKRV